MNKDCIKYMQEQADKQETLLEVRRRWRNNRKNNETYAMRNYKLLKELRNIN